MQKSEKKADVDRWVELCKFMVDTKYEDISLEEVNYAKTWIMDTMAITIGGSGQEGIPEIVRMVRKQGGKRESLIPFYGGRVPAPMAAFAIGPMTRALDMGDISPGGHNSEYVFPALLAATGLKRKVTGKEFITAFIVGTEVLNRIGSAHLLPMPMDRGMAIQGGHYIFGATAGVANLLGLNLEQTMNAMGIVRAMTQPWDMQMYQEATLVVRVHHGFVAQDAINACLLAKAGITGPHNIMLGPRGYLQAFSSWETNPGLLTNGLGKTWTVTSFKLYMGCYCAHSAVGAVLDLVKVHNIDPKNITAIRIDTSPINWMMTGQPEDKWNPQTVFECQFSMPYMVATAVITRRVFIDSYSEKARVRQDVRNLMKKIEITPKDELMRLEPPRMLFASRPTIVLKDGREYTKEALFPRGTPDNPMSKDEFLTKFRRCAAFSACKLSDAVVDQLIDKFTHLESVKDIVAEIIEPITP